MSISVLEYSHLADFLRHYYEAQRSQSKTWSLTVWARRLKLKNKAILVKAVNGTRPVSIELEELLINYFDFQGVEADYFRVMSAYTRVKSRQAPPDIRKVLQSKNTEREKHTQRVPDHLRSLFLKPMSNWIRSLAWGEGIPVDHDQLMKMFKIDIEASEVQETIAQLVEAGMLIKNKAGDRWHVSSNEVIWATAHELGMKEASQKQLMYLEATQKQWEKTLDVTTPDRVRGFALTLKISEEDLAEFSHRVHDAITDIANTYVSAAGSVLFQAQFTGLRVAEIDPLSD